MKKSIKRNKEKLKKQSCSNLYFKSAEMTLVFSMDKLIHGGYKKKSNFQTILVFFNLNEIEKIWMSINMNIRLYLTTLSWLLFL